jgi:hypothetical protein
MSMRRIAPVVLCVAAFLASACGGEDASDGPAFSGTLDDPVPARTAFPVDPDRLLAEVGAVRAVTAAELEADDPQAILDVIEADVTYVLVEITLSNIAETTLSTGISFWPLFGDEQRSIYNASCGSLAIDLRQAVREIPPGESVDGEVCLLAPATEVAAMRIGILATAVGEMLVFEHA